MHKNVRPHTEQWFYTTSVLDVLLIIAILVSSLYLIVRNTWPVVGRSLPEEVLIHQGKVILKRADLKSDGVLSILDGRMKIEVKDGQVRVIHSDCPQKICMHTGRIRYPGQTIVCVPNRVLIEVKSRKSQVIDAVAQ